MDASRTFLDGGNQTSVKIRMFHFFALAKEPDLETLEPCEYIYAANMEEGTLDSIQNSFGFLPGEVGKKNYVGFEK